MSRARRPRSTRPRRLFTPRVEPAERRTLLAVFTVTNTDDNATNPPPGAGTGTLRQAIIDANAALGMDDIIFQFQESPSTVIQPLSPLPALTSPVAILGSSATNPTLPGVVIDGRLAGFFTDGLVAATGANGSIIEGLQIVSFGGNGILVATSTVTVRRCFIGTDPTGSSILGNGNDGIRVTAPGNLIGGPSPQDRNVIAGNVVNGVELEAGDNRVFSNIIGVGDGAFDALPSSFKAIPNQNHGIAVAPGAHGVFLGAAGAGNLIAANLGSGINVLGADGSVIQGNAIGTSFYDVSTGSGIGLGPGNIGNGRDGITLSLASATLIGGTDPGAGNVISGNLGTGARIVGNGLDPVTPGNTLQGNVIGTDISGTSQVSNLDNGVIVESSIRNTIGGDDPAGNNVISGNVGAGIFVNDPTSVGTIINGNFIGTDKFGAVALPNTFDGVTLLGARGTRIGGAGGNVISGNRNNGVGVLGPSPGTHIVGNTIGLSVFGTALGNGGNGVALNATGNTVGGADPADRNVISANQGNGIAVNLLGSAQGINTILGNYIGVGPDGRSAGQGNQQDGILIRNATGTVIGDDVPGAGNVVTGNRQSGIHLSGTTTASVVEGNLVGLDADGKRTGAGNFVHGVFLDRVSGNTVGGTAPGSGNVASGNGGSGIVVLAGSGNLLVGNRVGTDPMGAAARGNAQRGILLAAASNNTVGGTTPGSGNLISGNDGDGLLIQGVDSSVTTVGGSNLVVGNLVGADASGLLALGNGQNGVAIVDSPGNTLGGTSLAARNVISANGQNGVAISGAGSSGNSLLGNFLGTDRAGARSLGNQKNGVLVSGAPGNLIGAETPGAGNVISGNAANGIQVGDLGATGNTIAGNRIGTDVAGGSALGNAQNGVFFTAGALDNVLGGMVAGSGNVIAANAANGVSVVQGASRIVIQGNAIGTDLAGARALGNGNSGVALNNAADNLVGGAAPGAGNVISGNLASGVSIFGGLSQRNRVQGNRVGTNAAGTAALGNTTAGISIDSASGNLVGGSSLAQEGNLVSGNAAFGVVIAGTSASGNRLEGNLIGTNRAGISALANTLDGVLVNAAPGNTIGGKAAAARNVISGNGGNGIQVLNILAGASAGPGVSIVGNFIGTDAAGASRLGNALDGVLINGVANASIVAGDQPNVIAANGRNGVEFGLRSTFGVVQGNLIGTDATGSADLGNKLDGVLVADSLVGLVGGSSAGQGNVISANGGAGVHLLGTEITGHIVQGNRVGTDASGARRLANRGSGIVVEGVGRNLVGGSTAAAGNLVSGNAGNGVLITGATATGNVIVDATIGTDATGNVAIGNVAYGISIEGASKTVVATSLISANGVGGIQIVGTAASGNVIVASTIGANRAGNQAIGNPIGVFINGSPNNVVSASLISGNSTAGIYIFGRFAAGNALVGNRVGTDASGLAPLSPATSAQQAGVLILQAPGTSGSSQGGAGNMVGGADASARNVISGNLTGVVLIGGDTRGNVVAGNFIGVGLDGQTTVPNGNGVYLNGAPGNIIGGAAGNVISGNTSVGVYLLGNASTGNLVTRNYLGLDASGTKAVPNQFGFYAENAPRNTVGGASSADRNVVSGNSIAGVYIVGTQATGNLVQSNYIGPNATNTAVVPNLQYGVLLFNAANNTVPRSGPQANLIVGSGIANFREFTGRLPTRSTTSTAARALRPATPTVPSGPRGLR